ncbi:putative PurR-regulated permease PerM [Humibacillus xanthopallidus]|uniref:Putative PurR-regulated permease PerM n=1 Tax=Humibacillus xanthopallidus TaxID=412689 RepID=A0A543PMY5_9MICO|nr:AI-2E family transporter [Humibacillus xanthopallidus]TQN45433.1 putative PurR-regulated permease PerM [Humibacillus xanthopallidus]
MTRPAPEDELGHEPPPEGRHEPASHDGVHHVGHHADVAEHGTVARREAARRLGANSEHHPQWIAIPSANVRRIVFTVLVSLVGLWIAIWAFEAMSSFLLLLLLAWLLSIAMEPAVLWLAHRGMRRGVATGLTMLAMLIITAALAELFGQVFISQLSQLGQQLPNAVTSALDWVNSTFKTSFDIAQIQNALELTPSKIGDFAGKYGGGILGIFGSVFTFIFDALTILVFAYYFSADSPRLRQTIGSWLPQRYQHVFITVWTISVEKTGGYVVSKVLLATLSSFFHAAFFWFIDVPFWLPLGVFAGIVGQFIPTIGTYIGVVLPALFALLDKPINALWIALFATVYQQLENYVFTPKISRRTMDVHPAVALGSVIAGAALLGAIGAVIGIPVAAVLLAILDTFRQRHELVPELASLQPPDDDEDEDEDEDDEDADAQDADAADDAKATPGSR